ncbi:hypothetical protein [Klebsiella variicola]|uniref:hypothetical protein n=1 Tax=Klebsiella variicola TaxID=244366 RepID=UPI002B0618C4|nr:hypothetical protein [Klebsiella variicola]
MAQLTPQEKVYVDDLAMQRVDDMNSDEFLVRQLDDKIHGLASHLKAYFEERLAFRNAARRSPPPEIIAI